MVVYLNTCFITRHFVAINSISFLPSVGIGFISVQLWSFSEFYWERIPRMTTQVGESFTKNTEATFKFVIFRLLFFFPVFLVILYSLSLRFFCNFMKNFCLTLHLLQITPSTTLGGNKIEGFLFFLWNFHNNFQKNLSAFLSWEHMWHHERVVLRNSIFSEHTHSSVDVSMPTKNRN